ncbi:LacI family DNA-binding transcriptional regulator [Planctomonas psychrotolerans]|uniref:LacI family DNA-binding transcriptional regulator n=1 Tax=Planctomonas psychrotolerans TaxID=2528712 RepID=UPI001D0D5E32|nr:LacI family DNA-binding transcriptional regulator [Planctomonas psychrotolerans]
MATMRDVARLANVSIATVSFTLNNTKPVAPATRLRVEQAMEELKFRRNPVARALASRRTRIIALLYPALQHRFSGTVVNFFTSAAQTASEHGYTLVLWPISNDAAEVTELVDGGLVDGVLLMEVQLDDPRVERLRQSDLPFALIGRTRDPSALSYVDIDFENTTAAAVDHLVDLGHRAICLLNGSVGSSALEAYGPVARTEAAFDEVMRARGLTPVTLACDETPIAGRAAASELLERAPDATAVIVMNEHAAFGFVSGLTHRGLHVPRDMSILSIASSRDMAAISDPELTCMAAPGVELGRMGVEALLDQLEGRSEKHPQALVMCTFVPGQSTGPAPDRRP